jgi:hypothetical protein
MYGRSWAKELFGAVGAVAVPYLGATMAKATGKPLTSALVTVGAGVVGTLAKGSIRDANWHEFAEGAGYGGLGYFGPWLAANTTTLGGKPAGNIPLQDIASSAAAARAIAAARSRAAAARAGAASFPPSPTAQTSPLSGYRPTQDLSEAV